MLHRLFHHSPFRYLVAFCLGAVLVLLCLWRDGFTLRMAWGNGLTVAGAVLILLGLLGVTTYHGAFDIFGYAFSSPRGPHHKNLYEYASARQEKRRKKGWTFGPWLAIGMLYLLAGVLILKT